MNYIVRNHKFDIDNNKAFEIYSDSTCEHLEYTCNYNDMLEIMQENIYLLASDGLISYRQGWRMRDDYIMYNEYVELFEKYETAIKAQKKNIIKKRGKNMRPLQMIEVVDYDYNNSGQIVTYYKRPKPATMDFWNGKEFHEWDIELLQSEGYKLMILKTIELHAE